MEESRRTDLRAIFEAARGLDRSARRAYLDKMCGDDPELRAEVERLWHSLEDVDTAVVEKPDGIEIVSGIIEDTTKAMKAQSVTLSTANFVAGTVLADRYRIIGLLGKGGMGEVYKAEDLKLEQTVALKFLPDQLARNSDALRRFVGEVKTARRVSHPNVCRVFDIGETGGHHFLSMEYLDGDDLASLLRRIGRLPSDKAAEISKQICFGLQSVHEAGILHRDLKPANIIIDSTGKARITDFGIAGFEADLQGEESRVGTPAYMSPEQITGKEVSIKSDIYSLGLLIYEIYTGQQAFEADSLNQLAKKLESAIPTNPSKLLGSIDPLAEKTIQRCLEKNPSNRPGSALQVAMSLPGGNPLEAALAAGETPSPEMVAAAPKKGALNPKLGLGLLLSFFVIFILFGLNQQRSKVFNVAPLEKPPEVLAEKSREILKKLGYVDPPADSVYGFQEDEIYFDYANTLLDEKKTTYTDIRKAIASGEAPVLTFLYRQSPEYLQPNRSEMVTDSDPVLQVPNMANVKLDTRGQLLEFVAVPPAIVERTDGPETDWKLLFSEAGLDILAFKQIASKWTPPVFADERLAWEGNSPAGLEVPLRIEAASLNGKAVFFRVAAPWNEQNDITAPNENIFRRIGVIAIILIYCLVLAVSILFARNNLKAGRGDLRGALKLMIFLFTVFFGGRFIYADHVPTVWGELGILYMTFARSLIPALFIGLIYIALEPFVRRYWSELLISWNRLLNGEFRDPLIGRDVLFGLILGAGHTFGIFVGSVVSALATGNNGILSTVYVFQPVNGFSGIIYAITNYPANAISVSFVSVFVLLGFYILTKRKTPSILLLFFLVFSLQGLIFVLTQHWGYVFAAIINAACLCIVLSRFGLVGMISFWIAFYLTYQAPLTLNSLNLYFPNTVATSILAFALAAYAFYVSTAGQPIFGGKSLGEFED